MQQSAGGLIVFWSHIASAFSGEKLDDDKYQDGRAAGAYPNLSQQLRDPQVLKAGDDCQVMGHTHTNREHIQEVVRDYWHFAASLPDRIALKDPFEPGITVEEAFKRRRKRDKLYPKWDGQVLDMEGNVIDEDDRFNASEVRAIREFGKLLMKNKQQDWLEKLVDPENWAIGDTKLICDSNKVNDAQTSHRSALTMGEEFKDGKDLGIYGPWKTPWKEEPGMLEGLKNNWGKVWGVRSAQLAGNSDMDKEVESARKALSHFSAEEAAVKNATFAFAFGHGDLTEYIRLSPNYDDNLGWVKIPKGLSPEQVAHIQTNITKLATDSLTTKLAAVTGRSIQDIAALRELFFRSKEMTDRLSGGLHINWNDAWDYMTEARALVSLTIDATDWKQRLQMARQGANRTVHTVTMARVDLPGKMLDARLATIIAFGLSLGLGLMINIWVFGDTVAWLALIEALILTLTFDRMVGIYDKHEFQGKFYVMLGLLVLVAVFLVVVGGIQREGITNDLKRQYQEFHQAVTR